MSRTFVWTLALVASLIPGGARAQEVRQQSSRDWDTAGIGRIVVTNPRGLVSLRPSRDGRIHLVALKLIRHGRSADAEALARATRVETGRSNERLWIRVVYPQRREIRIGLMDLMRGVVIAQAEVRLAVEVPATLTAELQTASGDLESDGISGPQVLKSVSGEITVGSAGGSLSVETASGDARLEDVSGASIQTTSGDIVVVTSRGPIEAESVSGDVRIEAVDDSVDVSTTSGEVTVGRARGGLRVDSGSGDVTARASGRVEVSTTSGEVHVTLDSPLAQVGIRTLSGDVTLRLPTPADCRLDAQTSSGTVDVNLPMDLTRTGPHRIEGTIGRGTNRVWVRSSSGSVDVNS